MSDIKSAYKSVALAVWQSLVQQYPDELVEEDSDDLETLNQVLHADSSSQNITKQQAVENPVSSEQD
ncbi:MAG: hypothetical protein F6K14_18035 [Symploca sp. SIO2C1]|nr:hypothetical protein [Symploca sp. SIO2C1]